MGVRLVFVPSQLPVMCVGQYRHEAPQHIPPQQQHNGHLPLVEVTQNLRVVFDHALGGGGGREDTWEETD